MENNRGKTRDSQGWNVPFSCYSENWKYMRDVIL